MGSLSLLSVRALVAKYGGRRLTALGAVALLAVGAGGGVATYSIRNPAPVATAKQAAPSIDERQAQLQASMARRIETMLGRIIGPGNVRAEVAVEIDTALIREESELYDPDRQVVARSMLDDGGTAEDISYENSRTRKTLVREPGGIRRITVSVMLNGPRSPVEIERFTRLVQNAIGYDELRGDSVLIESLRFSDPAGLHTVSVAGTPIPVDANRLIGLLQTIILGVVGLVAVALLVRPLMRRTAPALPEIAEPARKRRNEGPAEPAAEANRPTELQEIGAVVERNPNEATAIIRQWMYS